MPAVVEFAINGERHAVPLGEARAWTLARYLRERTRFTGTKVGCGQGGCGACTVVMTARDPGVKADPDRGTAEKYYPAAACLYPLVECHGRAVRTAEGLVAPGEPHSDESKSDASVGAKAGGRGCCRRDSPHPIQRRVADFHGTQCGFCTPGMVMAMFGALNRNDGGAAFDGATAIENEDILAGNLCRCTGYRPLNAALKSFARGTDQKDHIGNVSSPAGPYDTAKVDPTPVDMTAVPALAAPFRPTTLEDLIASFCASGPNTLVIAGHTGHGVAHPIPSVKAGRRTPRMRRPPSRAHTHTFFRSRCQICA